MWSPIDQVRINLGYHHFFDKKANWYNNTQDLLDHDTNEYLAGAEWDITDRFTVSAGGQLTRYGLTDQYMNDMSFVTNSFSYGFGYACKNRAGTMPSSCLHADISFNPAIPATISAIHCKPACYR